MTLLDWLSVTRDDPDWETDHKAESRPCGCGGQTERTAAQQQGMSMMERYRCPSCGAVAVVTHYGGTDRSRGDNRGSKIVTVEEP